MPTEKRSSLSRSPRAGVFQRRTSSFNPLGLLGHHGFKMTAAILILLAAGSALLSRARTPPVNSLPRKIERTRQSLANLRVAVEQFRLDTGRYPTADEGLPALVLPPEGVQNWDGPYIVVLKNDLWGRPFRYWIEGDIPRLAGDGPDQESETEDDLVVMEEGTRIEFLPTGGLRAVIAFSDGHRQAVVDETLPPPRAIRTRILPEDAVPP